MRLIDANELKRLYTFDEMDFSEDKWHVPVRVILQNIDDMPTVDPVKHGRWIPCSERLPEDYTDVLVWFEYFRYGDYNCLYQTYGIGDYSTEYDSWMINHETGWHKLRVIAWMPLPEPYKMDGDEE